MIKIKINPFDNIQYVSFYIYGFESVFGTGVVQFDSAPFALLSNSTKQTKGVLFVFQDEDKQIKGYISANDFNTINEEIYNWCDVYASVNANFQKNLCRQKLISLAPSFAIKCWFPAKTLTHAIAEGFKYLKWDRNIKSLKTFIGNYKRLYNRPYYSQMSAGQSEEKYVFFCSTLWYSDEWNKNDKGLNLRRANFIRACKSVGDLHFEGGLVSQPGRSSDDLFADCLLKKPYSYNDWLDKTKRSSVVFNTPAFWDCHGWKLGEYLALGKAIISTPLSNDLPAPLVHGEHIHFIQDTSMESLSEAIEKIVTDCQYREKLEHGARQWWDKYGTPEKSIEHVLSFLNN